MIRTGRQDIYNTLVKRASGEAGKSETTATSGDFVFDYQYELFSLGLVVGYLHNHPNDITVTGEKGQDILRIGNLSESNEHRQTVEYIHQLVKMEQSVEIPDDVDEVDEWLSTQAWDYVLEYADEGIVEIQSDIEVQEDFDFLRMITEMDSDIWQERLEVALTDHI